MFKPVFDHFRCPESLLTIDADSCDQGVLGYFRFGEATCFGKLAGKIPAQDPSGNLCDALNDIDATDGKLNLPFYPAEIIENLRSESYPIASASKISLSSPSFVRSLYYLLRPMLPVAIRKWTQRAYLSGWQESTFPKWPVDFSVDSTLEQLLALAMKAKGLDEIPFIWFWPNGKKSCVIMTHDVETLAGRDFTSDLMDLDDRYGFKSSFQVIPEKRYEVPAAYIDAVKNRGFEVNVHDLYHDGSLFRDHNDFLRQAGQINDYGKEWGAAGFRAGVLYRMQEWFDALDFQYDMSVPNLGVLDPQHGGCCTTFPYFIGDLLEIPLTAMQDYTLFHILHDSSIDVWRKQIDIIRQRFGLISFIVHPDYIIQDQPRGTYEALLQHIAELREPQEFWTPLPGELNRWWRDRQMSQLVKNGSHWTVEGPAKEQAMVAFARTEHDHLVFDIESTRTDTQSSFTAITQASH